VLVEMPAGTLQGLRWAPDGNRLSFGVLQEGRPRLMLANASGGRALPVDEGARGSSAGVWSPDGEWLAYQRRVGSEVEVQLVKTRPGSRLVPEVLKKWRLEDSGRDSRTPVEWSPDGRWILASRGGAPGLFLVSPDGGTERQLSATRSSGGRPTFGFSRDGRAVLFLEQNISGAGAPWRLFSIDVATGAERLVADVGLPPTAGDAAGFSLHPDGTRFLTSIANWPFDLWMLEGFDQ
jgi:Tol biopolymer transport system component